MSKPTAQTTWQIFRWPTFIGAASVVGLASALIGDGWYDAVSWLSLGLTVVVMVVAYRRD